MTGSSQSSSALTFPPRLIRSVTAASYYYAVSKPNSVLVHDIRLTVNTKSRLPLVAGLFDCCSEVPQDPGPKFTDTVLRFILRCVIRSSEDNLMTYYLRILSPVVLRHLKGDRKILS